MNFFMNTQMLKTINSLKAFEAGLELAARKDDGRVDKKEAAEIKRIKKKTEEYIRFLQSEMTI